MKTSRKLTVIILLILTALFIAGSVFVATQIQNQQAPEDTSAFGFGADAVTDYFDELDGFFRSAPCVLLLNNGFVIALSNGFDQPLLDYRLTAVADLPSNDRLQRNCIFTEEDFEVEDQKLITIDNPLTSFFELEIRTYDLDSYIYESKEEKLEFINSYTLGETLDTGSFPEDKTEYFYGTSKVNPGECVGIIYHDTNEFEFAALTFSGYDCTDDLTIYKNKVYTKAISSFIDENITSIYGAAGFNPYN